jgi:hypothetical protein
MNYFLSNQLNFNTMKKLLFTGLTSILLLIGFSGCYKTCEDPFATNYTLKGNCIDLTASITGGYTGHLLDSIVGLPSSTVTTTLQLTKVDDSHVSVSSSNSTFVGYNAQVISSGNGYYLTVPSQTATNGLTVIGAGTYFGNATGIDGVYTTANRQLIIYTLAGTQYQGFTGVQQ